MKKKIMVIAIVVCFCLLGGLAVNAAGISNVKNVVMSAIKVQEGQQGENIKNSVEGNQIKEQEGLQKKEQVQAQVKKQTKLQNKEQSGEQKQNGNPEAEQIVEQNKNQMKQQNNGQNCNQE